MAGPCLAPGDCVSLAMVDGNLTTELIVSPAAGNALECTADGAFVQAHRMRHVTGESSTVRPGIDGLTQSLVGVSVALEDWAAGQPADTQNELTLTETLTYTNTSAITEIVRFEFVQGQTAYYQRAGWDVKCGLKTSWSGPAALSPVTALRSNSGFATGISAFNQAWDGTDSEDPAAITVPPFILGQVTEMLPGETLTLSWRLWASYILTGLPDAGGTFDQSITILFGSGAHIYAWSKG